MELPQNDSLFKVWEPIKDANDPEPVNNYTTVLSSYERKEENKLPEASGLDTGHLTFARYMLNSQISIHTFLQLIVDRSMILEPEEYSQFKTIFMADEAVILSIMLKRDGFFDNTGCGKPCVACATEKLESQIIDIMRRQMEILYLARKFYTQTENVGKYNICVNHREPNVVNNLPNNNLAQPNATYNWTDESIQRYNIEILQRLIMQVQNNSVRLPFLYRQPNNIYNSNIGGYQSNFDYINQNGMQQNNYQPTYLNNSFDSFIQNINSSSDSIRNMPNRFSFDQARQTPNSDNLKNYIYVPMSSYDLTRPELTNYNANSQIPAPNDPFSYSVNVPTTQSSNYMNNVKAPPGFSPNIMPATSANSASNLYSAEDNYYLNMTNQHNTQLQVVNNGMRNNTNISNLTFSSVNETATVRDNRNNVRNTIDDITREFQQQFLLGNRLGRKILGKKY